MSEDQSLQTDAHLEAGAAVTHPESSDSHEAIAPTPDHPHSGVPEDGWSAPQTPGETCNFASLVVKRNGAETDIVFPICSPATVGRFDPAVGPIDVDLGLMPEGAYVSRKHARLTQEDGVWKLKDLGSSNGTFILRDDFEKVDECELSDGSEIALGNARFVFHLTGSPAP
jgi:hypothetical protein